MSSTARNFVLTLMTLTLSAMAYQVPPTPYLLDNSPYGADSVRVWDDGYSIWLRDFEGRPLVREFPAPEETWPLDTDYCLPPGPPWGEGRWEYALPDAEGRLQPSGIPFPGMDAPETQWLEDSRTEELRQRFYLDNREVSPWLKDLELTVIPLRIVCDTLYTDDCSNFPDCSYWANPQHPDSGLVTDSLLYHHMFFSEDLRSVREATGMGGQLWGSLKQYWRWLSDWENNGYSDLVTDTARCDWYGERPGWLCDPEGREWEYPKHLKDEFGYNGFLERLDSLGVDVSHSPERPIMLLLGPRASHMFRTDRNGLLVVSYRIFYVDPEEGYVYFEETPTGSYAQELLKSCLHLTPTVRLNPQDEDFTPFGSGVWDVMAHGDTGWRESIADNTFPHLHSPADLNAWDRIRLGWVEPVYLEEPTALHLVDRTPYVLLNPRNHQEALIFHAWDREDEAPTRHHHGHMEEGPPKSTGLVEHAGYYRSAMWDSPELGDPRYVSQILWAELVPGFMGWDERYRPFPTPRVAWLDFPEWKLEDSECPNTWTYHFTTPEDHSRMQLGTSWVDSLIILAEDGFWQREIPLGFHDELELSFYNAGRDITSWALEIGEEHQYMEDTLEIDGPWNQNTSITFLLPEGRFSIPDEQSLLGSPVDWRVTAMELFPDPDTTEVEVHSPFVGLRPSFFLPEIDQSALLVSRGHLLAMVDGTDLELFSGGALVDQLQLDEEPNGAAFIRFAGYEGDPSHLALIGDTQMRLLAVGPGPALQPEEGWPVGVTEPGPFLVTTLEQVGECVCLVEDDRITLRYPNGVLATPRSTIELPDYVLPVRELAWSGGDLLGDRFVVIGGPLGNEGFILVDLDGNLVFSLQESELDQSPCDFGRPVVADLHHNGVYEVLMPIPTYDPYGMAWDDLLVFNWSELEQNWDSFIIYAEEITEGMYHRITATAPLRGEGHNGQVRLVMHVQGHMQDHSLAMFKTADYGQYPPVFEDLVLPMGRPRHLITGKLDEDGRSDLVSLAIGYGLEFHRGTYNSLQPWSEDLGGGALVHETGGVIHAPVPLMSSDDSSARLLIGLREEGGLRFYDTGSSHWPDWPGSKGQNNTCQLADLLQSHLVSPQLSAAVLTGSVPQLLVEPLEIPDCTSLRIYRDGELADEVPWTGELPLTWTDQPLGEGHRLYEVRAVFPEFSGPDGRLFR